MSSTYTFISNPVSDFPIRSRDSLAYRDTVHGAESNDNGVQQSVRSSESQAPTATCGTRSLRLQITPNKSQESIETANSEPEESYKMREYTYSGSLGGEHETTSVLTSSLPSLTSTDTINTGKQEYRGYMPDEVVSESPMTDESQAQLWSFSTEGYSNQEITTSSGWTPEEWYTPKRHIKLGMGYGSGGGYKGTPVPVQFIAGAMPENEEEDEGEDMNESSEESVEIISAESSTMTTASASSQTGMAEMSMSGDEVEVEMDEEGTDYDGSPYSQTDSYEKVEAEDEEDDEISPVSPLSSLSENKVWDVTLRGGGIAQSLMCTDHSGLALKKHELKSEVMKPNLWHDIGAELTRMRPIDFTSENTSMAVHTENRRTITERPRAGDAYALEQYAFGTRILRRMFYNGEGIMIVEGGEDGERRCVGYMEGCGKVDLPVVGRGLEELEETGAGVGRVAMSGKVMCPKPKSLVLKKGIERFVEVWA
ncbi:hypothetical protein BDZ91DRAFT_723577, partial [Kalaharituber pfeilii]